VTDAVATASMLHFNKKNYNNIPTYYFQNSNVVDLKILLPNSAIAQCDWQTFNVQADSKLFPEFPRPIE
jgi:hypothetical protein